MSAAIWTALLLAAVGGSILVELFSERSGATAAISGFFLVFCGTLLMARLSHRRKRYAGSRHLYEHCVARATRPRLIRSPS